MPAARRLCIPTYVRSTKDRRSLCGGSCRGDDPTSERKISLQPTRGRLNPPPKPEGRENNEWLPGQERGQQTVTVGEEREVSRDVSDWERNGESIAKIRPILRHGIGGAGGVGIWHGATTWKNRSAAVESPRCLSSRVFEIRKCSLRCLAKHGQLPQANFLGSSCPGPTRICTVC